MATCWSLMASITASRDSRQTGVIWEDGAGQGQPPASSTFPWGIATDSNDNVFVADWRNDRIQKFDADGKPLKVFGTPGNGNGELHRPSGVTLDDDGNLYIADWGNHRVQILDPEGKFLTAFRGSAGLSKWSDDYFRVNPDELEERQKADLEPDLDPDTIYDTRDESASIEKYFWGPTAVRLDDDGRMFVVDSCRHRIQVYQREQTQG